MPKCFESSGSLPGRTLRIHGTIVYSPTFGRFLWVIVGKYTSPMDPMGNGGLENTGSFQRG